MFKNMLKRSWLSTIRKPSRTIILALILFVMANLMLATIAINGAVKQSVAYAKETLSGTVYLQADMEKFRDQMQQQMRSGTSTTRPTRPEVALANAQKIADGQYVKDFTYSYQTTANASGFTLVKNEDSAMMGQFNQMREQMRARPGGDSDASIEPPARGDTQIQGINAFAFINNVQSGTMKLAEGEALDENSTGVMISADLATDNNLKVGDEISLSRLSDNTKFTLKIIGTYETTSDNFNANTIYTSVKTATELASVSTDDFNNGNFAVEDVRYYLTNAEHKDQFIAEAKQQYPTLTDDGLTLDIDDNAYQQMVGPIESVGSFANTIFWVVAGASILIITLIITINVKDRRYEMGVLLSLGAKRSNIAGQILTELLLIGTIAFAVSIGTGSLIAKTMGNSLLQQQLTMNQTQQTNNFGRGLNAGRPGGPDNFGGEPGSQTNQQVEAISTIDVNATTRDYTLLFAAGYAIIILSLILPTTNILRYQPKTILTGKE